MRIFLIAVTCGLTSLAASAAVELHFRTVSSGEPALVFSGTGWISGPDFRMELDSGNHPLYHGGAVIIQQNGGAVILVLDPVKGTYFMRTTERMRGTVSTFNAPWQIDARDISVKIRPQQETEVIAGHETRKHYLDISYTIWMLVEDSAMKAFVTARAELWLSDIENEALPWGFHYGVKTGFPDVDKRIARALRGRGLPLRQIVTASRSIDRGPAVEERSTTEVDSISTVEVPVQRFRVSHAYRYVEPTMTLPERDQ